MRACFSLLLFRCNRSNSVGSHSRRLTAGLVTLGFLSILLSSSVGAQTLTSVAGDHKLSQTVERMELIVKSSRILTLDERIPRFQVHNEEVLGATPVSENQIQIFGKNPGTTQLNLWDTDDKLYTVDVTIVADAREVEGILSSQLPLASLKVTPINESAIISGFVTSVDDVDRAVAITEQFYSVVINNIEVVGVQQVLLHTKIMEVSRTKLRQLGIDFASYNGNYGVLSGPASLLDVPRGVVEGENGAFGFAPFGGATNQRININGKFESFVQALNEQKLVKLLAEPTVVATHGRPARFTVGGRVPNVIPGANGQLQVNYEDYGTSIDFLPFVVGPGRIRLEVRPEVSEPDPSRAITINNTNVQAFTARYVETAVEMQAGQTFALAGLLQTRTDSVNKSVPFLGSIPYIGTFFRSVEEKRNEIELLIMVTPELVDAMDPHQVPAGGPGLNSDSPDSTELFMHGHIEVPNLKGDNCASEGAGDCGVTGYGPMTGMEMQTQPMPMSTIEQAPVIYEGSMSAPTILQHVPQASVRRSTGYQGPETIPSGSSRVAQVASQPSFRQPPRSSSFESGTLLPSGSVVPGSEPTIVGEGVTISQPAYR